MRPCRCRPRPARPDRPPQPVAQPVPPPPPAGVAESAARRRDRPGRDHARRPGGADLGELGCGWRSMARPPLVAAPRDRPAEAEAGRRRCLSRAGRRRSRSFPRRARRAHRGPRAAGVRRRGGGRRWLRRVERARATPDRHGRAGRPGARRVEKIRRRRRDTQDSDLVIHFPTGDRYLGYAFLASDVRLVGNACSCRRRRWLVLLDAARPGASCTAGARRDRPGWLGGDDWLVTAPDGVHVWTRAQRQLRSRSPTRRSSPRSPSRTSCCCTGHGSRATTPPATRSSRSRSPTGVSRR